MALHDGPDHVSEGDIPSESTLRELYIEEGLTRQEVADRLDISIHAVRSGVQKHGVYKQEGHGPTVGPASRIAKLGEENDTSNEEQD